MPSHPLGIYAEQTAKRAAIAETVGAGVPPLAPEQAPATKTQAAGSSGAISAVYRATAADAWQDCEIIGYRCDGAVLRESGRVWPGVWIAPLDQVRIVTGAVLEIREFDGSWRRAA
jgi:hypothetical protein